MSEIKPGMVACMKTTDEPIFILEVKPITGVHVLAGMLSGVMAKVRRPKLDDKGSVTHVVEDFFVDEIETREDNAMRKVNEMEGLKLAFKSQNATASDKLNATN